MQGLMILDHEVIMMAFSNLYIILSYKVYNNTLYKGYTLYKNEKVKQESKKKKTLIAKF